MTPDPYRAGGGPGDMGNPSSWNRYSYVESDPVNLMDPEGLYTQACPPGEIRVRDVGCRAAFSEEHFSPLPLTFLPLDERADNRPTLQGPANAKQRKKFDNALKYAAGKLKKKECADDFGDGAVEKMNNATYTYGVSYKTNADGSPTATPNPDVYASTDVSSQAVTINMVGHFFSIAPTEVTVNGSTYVQSNDMGTGLSQTAFDAFVLLHELGHLMGVLGDDRTNQSLADDFNAKILKDCFGIDWHR
mgnify:CR=1 FL=1